MQKSVNQWVVITIALIAAGLLYLLAPILTPFLIAALLAYLADPLVNHLMRWRLPRLISVIIVFLMLIFIVALLVLLFIPLIQKQISILAVVIPNIIAWLQKTILPWVMQYVGVEETINIDTLKTALAENWAKAGGVANWAWTTTLHSGAKIIEWLTHLILIPVVTFYLLRDWNKIIVGVKKILPRKIEPTFIKLTTECDSVLSAFFRGQLLVMLSLGIIYSVGLSVIGLQIGLMIGLIAGLISIVPYLGFIVGIVSASIAAYVQFGSFNAVLLVWLVFVIGQTLESTLLTPRLVGHRIGLHPVAVIFAVLTGATLFGFFGVLLALPVAAVIMVLIRHMYQHYHTSQLYKAL